jgi:hypothetical protein
MSAIPATSLSSLELAVLVSYVFEVMVPARASSVVVKDVEGNNVVLRPGETAVVCTSLAVEVWVEEEIVENAAVEGVEVVVNRTVVVLGVVVHTAAVLVLDVVIRSVVGTNVIVGRLVVLVV